ncbi:MAG TPA: hypothetical protein DHU63_05640 [Candidatus Marinimicrobia bacterium]|nr:hypothetical protein [Candidatus Neomarinimicrobiota bacterium]
MAFTPEQLKDIESAGNGFLVIRRPPPEIRDQVDLAYKIEGQSVFIHEIRAQWRNPDKKIESPVAKATYVETRKHWKIFWMRADLKWHGYDPNPEVTTIADFFKIVHEDKHSCFWG